jgi:hypothetical protein
LWLVYGSNKIVSVNNVHVNNEWNIQCIVSMFCIMNDKSNDLKTFHKVHHTFVKCYHYLFEGSNVYHVLTGRNDLIYEFTLPNDGSNVTRNGVQDFILFIYLFFSCWCYLHMFTIIFCVEGGHNVINLLVMKSLWRGD